MLICKYGIIRNSSDPTAPGIRCQSRHVDWNTIRLRQPGKAYQSNSIASLWFPNSKRNYNLQLMRELSSWIQQHKHRFLSVENIQHNDNKPFFKDSEGDHAQDGWNAKPALQKKNSQIIAGWSKCNKHVNTMLLPLKNERDIFHWSSSMLTCSFFYFRIFQPHLDGLFQVQDQILCILDAHW